MARQVGLPQPPNQTLNTNSLSIWDRWLRSVGSYTKRIIIKDVSIDAPNVGANTTASSAVTVSGASTDDTVIVNKLEAFTAGLGIVNAYVSAEDTVTVVWMNTTAGAIDESSANYRITLIKK